MSGHNHGDGCGCGHDHEHEHDTITLSLDDGTELNCIVLDIFTVDGKEYIALQPEEGEEEDDNVFLYRFIQEGDDDPQLLNIDDDDEFEAVADAFEELLDAQEYDEMFGEEFEDEEFESEE
jgi:uncharacterized protein YrzB (UPF0473 family)